MGILHMLGGRHFLLANALTREIAKAAVRMKIGRLSDVSGSYQGVFRISGYGISASYSLGPQDTIGEILYWLGLKRFETTTVPLFVELARNSRGTLDIGANAGLYAILACAANPSANVMAWEPVPYLAEKLRANTIVNGFQSRIELRQAAAAGTDGQADFYVSDDTTMSSLSTPFATAHEHLATKITVIVERIDSVVPADFAIDLVKIDVEGHEFEALSGASETLRRWRPTIIFECLPQTDPAPIESLIRALDYTIYSITPAGRVEIDSIAANRGGDHNYLAVPAR